MVGMPTAAEGMPFPFPSSWRDLAGELDADQMAGVEAAAAPLLTGRGARWDPNQGRPDAIGVSS